VLGYVQPVIDWMDLHPVAIVVVWILLVYLL
jgi:hypothetical protein